MSMIGRWARWYQGLDQPAPYGSHETYLIGKTFLKDCKQVEDWGCGKGWMRTLLPEGVYRGIDGTDTPYCDEVVDLTQYKSSVEGVFMRHVLEHNYEWKKVLENAVASFTKKFVLVLFTPLGDETREIAYTPDVGVPDISFREEDITRHFEGLDWEKMTVASVTQYGDETVFLVKR